MQSILSKPLNKWTIKDINFVMDNLEDEEKAKFWGNPDNLLELNPTLFLYAFQRQDEKTKIELLKNETIAGKILNGPLNKFKKTPFHYLSEKEKGALLAHPNLLLIANEENLEGIFQSISQKERYLLSETLRNLIKNVEIKESNQRLQTIQKIIQGTCSAKELQDIWNISSIDSCDAFLTFCRQNKRNPFFLLSIHTNQEFLIYLKTNCIISEKEIDTQNINIEMIEKVNSKQLTRLVDTYREHLENNDTFLTDAQILTAALNVYLIFGHDDARKILLDYFTYPTESSKINQATIEFAEKRKEYRLMHQDEFYNHAMLAELYNEFVKITNGDTEIKNSHFFHKLLQTTDEDEYRFFYKGLLEKLHLPEDERKIALEEFLKEIIQKRETRIKNEYIEETKDENVIPFNPLVICTLFTGLDYSKINLDNMGIPIIHKEITKFFLGNTKSNNNCLLRMVISKNIFDLKDHIIPMINQYDIIQDIIRKANSKLSENSLMDVIKVYQFTTYSLDYDEKDLSLSTLAKISKHLEFIENSEIDIMKEMLRYHKLRKWKTNLTIPFVKGTTNEDIDFSILRNDSEQTLTAGIDHNCCFKPGAKGEDIFKFCLTNPNGGILSLKDKKQKKSYIVPFIVNGNTIYGNGIEPGLKNMEDAPRLFNAIQTAFQKIMENTIEEPIEVGVLSNLHIEKETFLKNYPEIQIDKNPANEDFYCDLMKKEKSLHIITQKSHDSKIQHYDRKSRYEQFRERVYYYSKAEHTGNTLELNKLENRINLIYYTDLKLKKLLTPQTFVPIKVSECDYIIGNDDWFILERNGERLECILPFYKDIDIEVDVSMKGIEQNRIGVSKL